MLRILWIYRLTSVRIAVAAQVFVQAGVLLLYLLNLLLVKRIWRDRRAGGGGGGGRATCFLRVFLGVLSGCTVASLVMVVVSIVVSVYTLDEAVIHQCRDIQRAGATYFLIVAAMPILLLARMMIDSPFWGRGLPHKAGFGEGGMSGHRWPAAAVVVGSTLLCLVNAGFKAGVVWAPARPLLEPAWYNSPACLYAFVFTSESCVVLLLISHCLCGLRQGR